ncbi:hypothetical protein [Mycobacterium sp. 236(2023)]|uniref:hypothetical protein n=1 Tax=Mycobacterium sp. 236(2023) TaxID=3038163 RepID=UPI0024157C05|nr:hypothetical protein [Mycobacterium sp. 236(2023)]MDG4667991.1 hypothetical protein [Mycobacterium sp. 236(2023)]
MPEGESSRLVVDVDDLMSLVNLAAVRFNEVSARRTDAEDEPDTFRLEVSSMLSQDEIVVRCKASVAGAGGEYVAEADGVFSLSDEVDIAEAVLLDFIQRVGIMVVYPYLRIAISDGAARLGVKTPVLRLLRPGDVALGPPDGESATPG